ncbi:MAG: site-specific DNA-methyltransferase [Clostridia bacterium]|nr:site-specific DNA-methyltransferase [Clostridia bacterium]
MDKLKMMSMDKVQANIEKIKALFPNAVTEVIRNGEPTLAVDFDVLKQEMSDILIDDKEERYQFTWPDKKKSILLANAPVSATLRPCREESVDFDTTENLYIEGDNLDVLKLLQETYLGKIKLIYIDPPYNTGNDFVYNDDFSESSEKYISESGQYDEQGNRLVHNTESNGRFHTDWLNMLYPRLKIAKDLLAEDGIIFISIDDNEQANLKKICDEIFGVDNFVNTVALEITPSSGVKRAHKDKMYIKNTEFLLVYRKSEILRIKPLYDEWLNFDKHYSLYFDGTRYCPLSEKIKTLGSQYSGIKIDYYMYFETIKNFIIQNSDKIYRTHDASKWATSSVSESDVIYNGERKIFKVHNPSDIQEYELLIEIGVNKYNRLEPLSWNLIDGNIKTLRGNLWLDFDKDMGNVSKEGDIPYPNGKKPVRLLTDIISSTTNDGDIVLDFFSGSATTAHATMQINAQQGTHRKFIMVQLPEVINYENKDNVKYYKSYGFTTICDLGKERIRIAGKKIKAENALTAPMLDTGFRVLKLDSSNMKDVFYRPGDFRQDMLSMLESNIKEDRSALDLLFQVMLELGKPLSAKIEEKEIAGKHVFIVDENDLIACFDENVTSEVVKAIAEMKPLYAVFRDNSLSSDSVAANFDQIFATYSPNTTRKVL